MGSLRYAVKITALALRVFVDDAVVAGKIALAANLEDELSQWRGTGHRLVRRPPPS